MKPFTANRMKSLARFGLWVILGVIVSFFLLRGPVLRLGFRKIAKTFSDQYHGKLGANRLFFSGFTSIIIENLFIIHPESDTLYSAAQTHITFRPLQLLTGHLSPSEIRILQPGLTLVYTKGHTNLDFLLVPDSFPSSGDSAQTSISTRIDHLIRVLFDRLPSRIRLTEAKVRILAEGREMDVYAQEYCLSDDPFQSTLHFYGDGDSSSLRIEGRLQKQHRKGEFKLYPAIKKSFQIPWIDSILKAEAGFDSLFFSFHFGRLKENNLKADIVGRAVNMYFQHKRISDRRITISEMAGTLRLRAGEGEVVLDSASVIRMNGLEINPLIRYQINPEKILELFITKKGFDAQELFDALPEGLFMNLRGMRVSGKLNYTLHFRLNPEKPDSLVFESRLRGERFRILSYGATRLDLMQTHFLHTVYEGNLPVRSFLVGPENPRFTPLISIAPKLQYAVITSEDGGFYHHSGFLPDAFREAMVENIKRKAFVRGGSTLTMQLVKNVFLNRHKNLTRKLEEALITWIIENQQLTEKERMMEVYLNIIEWGPGIYGIADASEFYFRKKPSQLTLQECVFLAAIIPSPKKFMYIFDKEGEIRDYIHHYFSLMAMKMYAKGYISESERDALRADIRLSGAALDFLKKRDSIPSDTLVTFPFPETR